MRVLFIEPYDGGSHRAFREGLAQRSVHEIDSLTLPPRFWKWRMRGGAAWFADAAAALDGDYDLIMATDYLNLADLRGLLPPRLRDLPALLYMHENQLTYPLSPEEEFDFHFGFTNIISCLAADRVVFNSEWHRDLFLDALPAYLGRMPEAVPRDVRSRIAGKSSVLPVGIDRAPLPPDSYAGYLGGPCSSDAGRPWPRNGRQHVILWNHRWEFDKRPDLFTRSLLRLAAAGHDFRLLLLGDSRHNEDAFAALRDGLGDRIDAWGRRPDRAAYDSCLAQADIVVSCAAQEYFGIAVAEAIHAGAYPVLPDEQVYPSLYGRLCRGRHFYSGEDQLTALLGDLISGGDCGHVCSLRMDCDEFCWDNLAAKYDALLEDTQKGRMTGG